MNCSPPNRDERLVGGGVAARETGKKLSRPRATVHLNIDFTPLLRGNLEPGDICEIPGVGPVSLTAARALLGDATVDLIIKKGDDIGSVVHHGRNVERNEQVDLFSPTG